MGPGGVTAPTTDTAMTVSREKTAPMDRVPGSRARATSGKEEQAVNFTGAMGFPKNDPLGSGYTVGIISEKQQK